MALLDFYNNLHKICECDDSETECNECKMFKIPYEDIIYDEPERKRKSRIDSYKFKIPKFLEMLENVPKYQVPRRYWAAPDTLVELCGNVVNQIPLPDAFKWTNMHVLKWLTKLGFPQYRNTFYENFINGRTLLLVDASALQAMNVKRFDHIQIITKAIRNLYQVEMILFNRSISLPPRYPGTHYKFYRVQTGPKYELMRPTDLWRKMKILRDPPPNDSHWVLLEKWLQHIPDYQKERIGYAPRRNLYKVKKAPPKVDVEEPVSRCICVPPCDCGWRAEDLRPSWRLAYLNKYLPLEKDDLCLCVLSSELSVPEECLCPESNIGEEDSADANISEGSILPCQCVPPCECGWTERDYAGSWTLTILKLKLN